MGQKTYLHRIRHKCPFCNAFNFSLETRQIYNEPNQKFKDDFVMTEFEKEIYLIDCFGICDSCGKRYDKKIGIKNSQISGMVI